MKRIVIATVLLVGCSHIPRKDAEWIVMNAKNISEVEERLGNPEREDYGVSYTVAHYQDLGYHFTLGGGLFLPGIGLIGLLAEYLCFEHSRFLHVTYDPRTGLITNIDPRAPYEIQQYR